MYTNFKLVRSYRNGKLEFVEREGGEIKSCVIVVNP